MKSKLEQISDLSNIEVGDKLWSIQLGEFSLKDYHKVVSTLLYVGL